MNLESAKKATSTALWTIGGIAAFFGVGYVIRNYQWGGAALVGAVVLLLIVMFWVTSYNEAEFHRTGSIWDTRL